MDLIHRGGALVFDTVQGYPVHLASEQPIPGAAVLVLAPMLYMYYV